MRYAIVLAILICQTFALPGKIVGQHATFDSVRIHGGANQAYLQFAANNSDNNSFAFFAPRSGVSLDIDGPIGAFRIGRIHRDAREGSFSVGPFGFGVGTQDGGAKAFHVYADESLLTPFENASVRVENAHANTELRTMFELVNNGPSRFELHNTDTDQTWAFQTNYSDGFLINRLGSGGNEFSIRRSGQITMGPGGKLNFVLDPAGNLTIDGSLDQNSDRDKKEAFEQVDCQEILDGVVRLPITTWRYKDDPPNLRHVGPMAQDFHRQFAVGKNNKTISAVDADGVAFAAIKALSEQLADAHERIEKLEHLVMKLAE